MKQYDKYKDSGIEWIGEIPSHWEVMRLGSLGVFSSSGIDKKIKEDEPEVKIINYTDVYGNKSSTIDSSLNFMVVTAPLSKIEEHSVKKGDLIFTPSSETIEDIGLSALVKEQLENTAFSYHVLRFQFKNEFSDEFKKYLCNNHFVLTQFSRNAQGTTRKTLGRNDFKNAKVVIPSIEEQTSIAGYLDRRTTEIDTLIAEKKCLLELYEEEKNTIINQGVTKGVDFKVFMKDSGVEWLGEIPEHWEVKKLKFIIKGFESGVSVNSFDNPISENEYGILKTSCVVDYNFRPDKNKLILNDFELQRAKVNPKKGMIIISRMNTPDLVGASGYVDKDYPNLFLPDRLWQTVFHQEIELDSKWLSCVFKSSNFRKLLSIIATGTSSSMKNIGQEDFLEIKIPFFNIQEQQSIVQHIETECARIDAKIDKTKKLIELLTEYRTALISEVVTGKIKVTE